jgi:hypothetical protein
MSTTIKGKGTRATRAGQLIAGTRKHFANGTQVLTFTGGFASVTVDNAVAELQKLIDNRASTMAARATAKDKVSAEQAATPALVAFMSAFEGLVRIMFGNDTSVLTDFGLQLRKQPVPKTLVDKATAAAKAKATRAARGTKGPKAKKSVKGNVTGIVVTPVTESTPAAPEAPAPANALAAGPGGATTTPPKG